MLAHLKSGFSSPPHQLLRISANGPGPFAEFCKRSRPGTVYRNPAEILKSWWEGLEKNTFFKGFLPVMCPVFCFFLNSLYMKRIFKKKIGPRLLLLATGTTDRKVRRSTGVTTANSTNKYQKYKSVELGDQLHLHGQVKCIYIFALHMAREGN